MTSDIDARIRDFLADEADRGALAAPSLDSAVGQLAPRLEQPVRRAPGRLIVLIAAGLLLVGMLGSAIAVGTGLVRLPSIVDPEPDGGSVEAVFLRLEVEGQSREVVVIGVDSEAREREIARLPGAWVTFDIGGGSAFLAPIGAVSPTGLLAMPSRRGTGNVRWEIFDLHDLDAEPLIVREAIIPSVEQLQLTPYFSLDMRPSVFWGPDDRLAIPWYIVAGDQRLALVDGRTGAAVLVDVPDSDWRILPQWTADGSGVLVGNAASRDPEPGGVLRSDGTVTDELPAVSDTACSTGGESGVRITLNVGAERLVRRNPDGSRQEGSVPAGVQFACLAPDDSMVAFNIGGDGGATAAHPVGGLITPDSDSWTEIEGSFAGWMEADR